MPLAGFLVAVGSAGVFGLMRGETAVAQSAACANAPFSANVESAAGVAFVDVGAQTASFVCINSPGFSGGSSGPLTADGTYGGGCYFVEGLGTSVVAVYWELPDVRPDCQMITNINVGTGAAPSPTTPAPTQPPATQPPATQPPGTQPAATATVAPTQAPSTPTVGAPTATPTRQATQSPATPAPTMGSVVATPTMRPPAPPATGNGDGGSGSSSLPLIGAGIALVAVAAGGALALRKRA